MSNDDGVTRALWSGILKTIFVVVGPIAIIAYFGYQFWSSKALNWTHLAIAVAAWLIVGFVWRWVRLPLYRR